LQDTRREKHKDHAKELKNDVRQVMIEANEITASPTGAKQYRKRALAVRKKTTIQKAIESQNGRPDHELYGG
jgi:hypothetical protein